jgi:DNA-binding NarL/FixJ family response regulator
MEHKSLTERENDVADLMAKGLNSREIADELNISFFTVKAHRRNIYKKLECKNLMNFLHLMHNNH